MRELVCLDPRIPAICAIDMTSPFLDSMVDEDEELPRSIMEKAVRLR